jgi:hypothetical protein
VAKPVSFRLADWYEATASALDGMFAGQKSVTAVLYVRSAETNLKTYASLLARLGADPPPRDDKDVVVGFRGAKAAKAFAASLVADGVFNLDACLHVFARKRGGAFALETEDAYFEARGGDIRY